MTDVLLARTVKVTNAMFLRSWEDLREYLSSAWNQLLDFATVIVTVAIILIIARVLNKYLHRYVWRWIPRPDVTPATESLVNNFLSIAVYFIAVTVVLAALGASWSALLTALSVSTLAVVLGLQDLLKSVLGGAFIVLERPYEVGERIQIREYAGQVTEIAVRTTVMRTEDGVALTIPNSLYLSEPFINLDRQLPTSSLLTVLGIEGDVATIRSSVLSALETDPPIKAAVHVVGRRDGSWLRSAVRSSEAKLPGFFHRVESLDSTIQIRLVLEPTDHPRQTERDAVSRMRILFPDAEISVRRGSNYDI